jgi:hypothetical protein
VPSDERAKRLTRRALGALHPNAVEKLEPEFSVLRNGARQLFQISFCCALCGMTARSHVTGIDGHKTIKVSTSSTRTLDQAAEQCVDALFRQHRECLPKVHVIAHGAHKQELKLDEAKTEALRRQRQLKKDASTLAIGADVPLDRANRKNVDPNHMERHVCGHFAEPKGQQKTDKPKRRRAESAGDVFGMLMPSISNACLVITCKKAA